MATLIQTITVDQMNEQLKDMGIILTTGHSRLLTALRNGIEVPISTDNGPILLTLNKQVIQATKITLH